MFSVQNTVSITDFRSDLSNWLTRAVTSPVLIFQNSKPKVAVVDPEYLEYLERYADGFYDAGDAAEVTRMIGSGKTNDTTAFNLNDYS